MRIARRASATVVAIVVLFCGWARGQVLDQVPAEALVVMEVNVGKYALITPTKEITALKPGGLKVQGAAAKEMNKDFAVWANMPRIRDIARPKLKENREKIVSEMETQLSQDPEAAKFAPVFKAGVNRFLDVVDQFLAESQAA